MARPRGVEPLTPRSVVWCSIQLSYGRLCRAVAGVVDEQGRQQLLQPPSQGKVERDRLTAAVALLRWDGSSGAAREKTHMADTATMAAVPAGAGEADDPARRPVVVLLPGGHRRAEAGHPW